MSVFKTAILSMLLASCSFAEGQIGKEYQVLMVDQNGAINCTNVLATQAEMSSNLVAVAIAEEKANVAIQSANTASNIVNDVVTDITESQLVVYRNGFTDAFASDIALPEDARLRIIDFKPYFGQMPDGSDAHKITYAVTHVADGIQPDVLFSPSPTKKESMTPIDTSKIGLAEKENFTYTDMNGTNFPYVYSVMFTAESSSSSFFCVYLSGDDSSSGATFDITGGITGGKTTTIEWGGNTLEFKGGLLVGVTEQ